MALVFGWSGIFFCRHRSNTLKLLFKDSWRREPAPNAKWLYKPINTFKIWSLYFPCKGRKHYMGCQFTRLTCCCRQRLPFSVQTTGGFYGVSVSDTSFAPSPQSLWVPGKRCGRNGWLTARFGPNRSGFHHVAGFVNVTHDTNTGAAPQQSETRGLSGVVIHDSVHLFKWLEEQRRQNSQSSRNTRLIILLPLIRT